MSAMSTKRRPRDTSQDPMQPDLLAEAGLSAEPPGDQAASPSPPSGTLGAQSEGEGEGEGADEAQRPAGFSATPGARGVLKKANEAVVMTPVSGDFIFLSRKAFNVLLYHAQQQGLEKSNRFGIPFSTLKRDAGFNSNDVDILKDRFRNLVRTTIEWGWVGETLDDAPKRLWSVTALLADAYFEINTQTRELWVYWSYSDTLKKQLLESREYTKLSLAMMARLRSLPALSLYELMARYQTNPSGLGRKLPWEQWVIILKGKPITDYPTLDYRRFNKETLTPAAAQVNQEQDEVELSFKEFRTGRKITHLQLVLRPRRAKGLGGAGPDNELRSRMDLGLFNRMLTLGVHQYAADAIYGSCTEPVLRAALEQVEARVANKKLPKVQSVEAYLKDRIRSLMEHIEGEGGDAAEDAPAPARADRARGLPPSLDTQLPRLLDEYVRHHLTQARAMYQEALEPQRQEWLRRFETEALPNRHERVREAYNKSGLKSGPASAAFFTWLSEATWDPSPSQLALIEFGVREGLVKFDQAAGKAATA